MKNQLKHFIRLVNFEFERMYKFLFSIMTILILTNLAGYIIGPLAYVKNANDIMKSESLNVSQYIEFYGSFSLESITGSLWIQGPIALGIIGFLFFSIFIWYREWLGKNTFIYRLLMLPISRMHIYFAKLLMVFIGIFSLLSLQIFSLWIGSLILPNLIPAGFFNAMTISEVISRGTIFPILLPNILEVFLGAYGLGLVSILVLFTIILLERSYHIKGLLLGILYATICFGFVVSPNLILVIFKNNFILFNSELIILMSIFAFIVGVSSILISRYLLKNKITV
ncbi:hypothetical protein [Marinilactibacillus psychrotolerans]|uniref:Uncharacterized protein n=2 Tax=Marinilactibacillus psychrotolerans TaxID=191770 RepID=A0A511GYR3_9LACT|nr:hypothetical protein [Marinilactibacillus psychrotolerans]TLQ06896.1 hypothetical protein FEZ48_08255 [Marinilactibacillus psychrotolerans]SDD16179.1 hypothetical protein SAMN04488013_11911 [Marinilactibacillus psychrotolerans]SJN24328.1 hypothetical protein FM115_02970 [Marinilactibacillus psychrotolerans 42ea]GEL66407.1 hypothetical protein MPS01_05620 [Marinilactibacillus psychrotolerans]GEQ33408.1 hypothetical protein B795N_12900 [Marinilactibacillus psychrotolerans]